jgi:hypothetical protein
MSEKEKKEQIVTINGKDYKESDFDKEQIELINHVADLDGKIARANFNLKQMEGGRIFHMEKLELSLEDVSD